MKALKYKFVVIILVCTSLIVVFPKFYSDKNFTEKDYKDIDHKKISDVNKAAIKINQVGRKDKFLQTQYTNYFLQKKAKSQSAANAPLIAIHMNGTPLVMQITKAPLKYNKEFAYSFTLDDGKRDAYTVAFPYLQGGYCDETGLTYPGFAYTDGCGNNIPYKAGIAINSMNANGDDPHQGNFEGSITWDQVKDLYYNYHWDVFNHSYCHKAYAGTDYHEQIVDNNTYIKSKTGIDLTHFVIPSGDSEYTDYAFALGMKAVYNQKDFQGGKGLRIDSPLALQNFKLYRKFLSDDNYTSLSTQVDEVADKSSSTDHYWYTEFTHHISPTSYAGSLNLSNFEIHMKKLDSLYGKNGEDKMWMAPLQEVYEYLYNREYTTIDQTEDGNIVYLTPDFSTVPKDLRNYAMTFLVNSEKDITNVECESCSKISFKGSGSVKLVNVEWPEHPSGIQATLNDVKDFHNGTMGIYPNPVDNKINLIFPGSNIQRIFISLISEQGIIFELGSNEIVNESVSLDLKSLNLKKGIYIIKASSEDGKKDFSEVLIKN